MKVFNEQLGSLVVLPSETSQNGQKTQLAKGSFIGIHVSDSHSSFLLAILELNSYITLDLNGLTIVLVDVLGCLGDRELNEQSRVGEFRVTFGVGSLISD